MLDRREFLKAGAGVALAAALPSCREEELPLVDQFSKPARSPVAILRATGYDQPLEDTLRRGLDLFPVDVRDKRVLLKPNFVEFDPQGVINTHPALLAAAIDAFRSLGAKEVIVGEGPGHRRDNQYLLSASGIGDVLGDAGAPYVDLNNDSVELVSLRSNFTELGSLYLPRMVLGCDLIVSLPKLKTHHWAGVTLSMKNMFGIVPGAVYGWPKNQLHWVGITESILDINASLPVPRFNIVDGIVGMEGNGPIQGQAKHSGVVVMGPDPVAVDSTCARLMSIDPTKIAYLEKGDAFLGNLSEQSIDQLGEPVTGLEQDYRVLESLRDIKAASGATGA